MQNEILRLTESCLACKLTISHGLEGIENSEGLTMGIGGVCIMEFCKVTGLFTSTPFISVTQSKRYWSKSDILKVHCLNKLWGYGIVVMKLHHLL